MDRSRATYDKGGHLVCPACAALGSIAEAENRASTSLISSAFAVLGGGVLSLTCFNPLFITSIFVLALAVGWLTSIGRLPQYRARLGPMYGVCVAVVIVGMVLAIAPVGAFIASTALRAVHDR